MEEGRWIEATLESEEMGRRVRKAIDACWQVHTWSNDVLLRTWVETLHVLSINELQPMMSYWLREQDMNGIAQRYSYDIALSRTLLRFTDNMRATREAGKEIAEVTLPQPLPRLAWPWLDLESRQVWKHYLEDHGRLTSWYGGIYLEGDWPKTMRGYAEDLKASLDKLPLLWNGITLREEAQEEEEDDLEWAEVWSVRFNFYRPQTKVGKRRTRKEKLLDG